MPTRTPLLHPHRIHPCPNPVKRQATLLLLGPFRTQLRREYIHTSCVGFNTYLSPSFSLPNPYPHPSTGYVSRVLTTNSTRERDICYSVYTPPLKLILFRSFQGVTAPIRSRDRSGRGTARAEDAQGTPTQSNRSPSTLVYEDETLASTGRLRLRRSWREATL